MIEKLEAIKHDPKSDILYPPSEFKMMEKINEIIEVINKLDLKRSKSEMLVVETCPKCGNDLTDLVICTYPPIPHKKCLSCGWEWTGERQEIIRVPFNETQETTHQTPITSLNSETNVLNQLTAMTNNKAKVDNMQNQSIEGVCIF